MADRGSVQGNLFEHSHYFPVLTQWRFSQDCDACGHLHRKSSKVKKIYILCTSAVKRLIMINRVQSKSFCLHNICMCFVYIYFLYKYKHMYICIYSDMYFKKIGFVYILNIFIYNINCMNINIDM